MKYEKKCPLTNLPCRELECGWFNDVGGECAMTTLGYKMHGIDNTLYDIRRLLEDIKGKVGY